MSQVQLLYCSSARHEMSGAELDAILATSVSHNEVSGITGALLYLDGCFIQVIEGEADSISGLYSRICADPRHYNIYLIYLRPIDQREFPRWSMSFRRTSWQAVRAHAAFTDLAHLSLDFMALTTRPGVASRILRQYCIEPPSLGFA
ncbi:MAG: hypothetical protein RJA44_1889 [Pseudomonadota bacterium]